MPKHEHTQNTPSLLKKEFFKTDHSSYNIYLTHKSFEDFTALYDWRAKAYRVAELLALPIRIRTGADCALEISLLEDAGMSKLEHGMDIELYTLPINTPPLNAKSQYVPEGFDYAELRIALNRIVRDVGP